MLRSFMVGIVASAFLFTSIPAAIGAPAILPASLTQVCSAIVYDLDNDAILFEQNPDEKIQPASLTKVLSMFLALDYISNGHASGSDSVIISPAAALETGSRMGLRANETVSLEKLLYGMAVSSGNDASYAVAEHVGGSKDSFVKMMNARARQLGMNDSHFINPNGLPAPDQYTTARDMATLARAYLKAHPEAMKFHNTLVLEHGGFKSWNRNPLIGQYPGANGLKTGWVRASGYNIIFTATRGNQHLLAVILGAPDVYLRSAEACRLLDAGFMVCDNDAVSVAAALDTIPLDLGRIDPHKTGRDHGLLKKRRIASRTVANKVAADTHGRKAHARLSRKNNQKNGHMTAKKAVRSQHGQKQHAERPAGKAKRG